MKKQSNRNRRMLWAGMLLILCSGCQSGTLSPSGPDSGATTFDGSSDADTTERRDTEAPDTGAVDTESSNSDAGACRDDATPDLPDASPGQLVATEMRPSSLAIDGKLDEQSAPVLRYDDAGESDNEVAVHARWTPDALYIGAEVTDDQVEAAASNGAWENDSFEVAVDPDASAGQNLEGDERKWLVDVDGTTRSGRADDGYWVRTPGQRGETAARETDDGYAIELRIPWDDIGGLDRPAAGDAPNLILLTNDRDDGQLRRFSWTGAMEQLETPSAWGTLQLVDDPCIDEDPSGGDAGMRDTSDGGDAGERDATDDPDPRLGPPRYLSESDFDFRTTLNAVDDLGMDPTGEDPIDAQLEQARDHHTLIEFPPGKYKIKAGRDRNATHIWGDDSNHFGLKGLGDVPKDVQFVIEEQPAQYGGRWLATRGGEGLMIKNIAFQMNWEDRYTSADMAIRTSDLVLFEKVEWAGLMPNDIHTNGMLLHFHVTDTDGVGEVNRLYIREGAIMPDYPNGAGGLRIGPSHAGTAYVTDLWMENNSSSALRFSKCPGRVGVEGGFYKNNANTNLRGGAGDHPDGPSYMRGATIVLDTEDTNDYQPDDEPITTTHGIRIDSTKKQWSGLIIEDIDMYFLNPPPGSEAIHRPSFGQHGAFTMRNVRIRNNSARPTAVLSNVPPSNDTGHFENIDVTGSGSGPLRAASGATAEIVDSCVESNFDIQNFQTVDNVSRQNCDAPTAPKADPHPH